jgi:hypothetical protein
MMCWQAIAGGLSIKAQRFVKVQDGFGAKKRAAIMAALVGVRREVDSV